tara:strand:+ start:111 stop:473 length:363 start_codon:yes stop_codon:yes gene_type:complete
MKTFLTYLEQQEVTVADINLINESLNQEWTEELENKIDEAVDAFLKDYQNEDGSYNIEAFNEEVTNEGLLGSIVGGLAGFALGKSVGKIIARVLGIEKGIFYDLLTSRLVGAALGASLGK